MVRGWSRDRGISVSGLGPKENIFWFDLRNEVGIGLGIPAEIIRGLQNLVSFLMPVWYKQCCCCFPIPDIRTHTGNINILHPPPLPLPSRFHIDRSAAASIRFACDMISGRVLLVFRLNDYESLYVTRCTRTAMFRDHSGGVVIVHR